MTDKDISGTCEGLDSENVTRVNVFMAAVVEAFETTDPVALKKISYVGGDPRGRKNAFEFHQSLMIGGDKVRAWNAKPYSEPDWDIMRLLRHHPPPTIWIDVTLNNGRRDYRICFPCAPDKAGVLRSCYYVDR